MLTNFLLTAWRNLRRNALYSVINITGLAVGLAVGIMIMLWVQDEWSYDRFHSNAGSIYKVVSHLGTGNGAQVWSVSPSPLAVFARKSIPEVAAATRIVDRWDRFQVRYGDVKFTEQNGAYVDPSFFSVFDFTLLKGNRQIPFADDHSIILTAPIAKKYFGEADPIGKVLSIDGKDPFTVTGVLEPFPENSTIKYDLLFPMSLWAKNFRGNLGWKTIDEDLGSFEYQVFLQVHKNAPLATVEHKLTSLYRKAKGESGKGNSFTLQPLTSLHLTEANGNKSALQKVRIFMAVGLLILAIACINYVNLSTARSMLRSREVSVRKIIGASRPVLFLQFIIESALVFLFASMLAFLIISILLPLYNVVAGKKISLTLSNSYVWLTIGYTIAGTLAVASIYPALLLSAFKPVQALRGKLSLGVSNTSFRKVLVVTQFTLSIGLIIATIVISDQLQFIRKKDLGFDKEQIFAFELKSIDHFNAMRDELSKEQGVLNVGSADDLMVGSGSSTGDTDWDGKEPGKSFFVHPLSIDQHFIPLLKIQLIAGNNFTGTRSDSTHFILNETAIKEAGISNPVGKPFKLFQTRGTIIGVVKDFNYASLKSAIEPMAFRYYSANPILYVKTTGAEASGVLSATGKVWKRYNADLPFQYVFLSDEFDKMYKADQRTGILFRIFTLVAIIISCLGLFGLATFTAQAKTKEVGIRRVLGASVFTVTNLLIKDFLMLVALSFIIAMPAAWWVMNRWLQDYTYRIHIGWWVFAITGLAAFLIALLTVGLQATKTAMTNPVTSLRSE